MPHDIPARQNSTGAIRHPSKSRELNGFAEWEYLKAAEQPGPFRMKQDKSERYWHLVLV